MQRKNNIDAVGAGVLMVCVTLMGLNNGLIKLVNEGLAPAFQAGMRSAFALVPLAAYMLIARKRISLSDGSLAPGIVTGMLFAIEFLLLFVALDYTTVSRASVFFYSMPLWVAIGAHFLIPGERLTRVRIAGLLLAIGGVALALSQSDTEASEYSLIGDFMCILAAMCWAGIPLVARTTRFSNAVPEMQLLYQLVVSALILTAVAPLFGDVIRDLTPTIAGIFAFQSFVVVAFGFTLWFWVLSVYPASDMAAYSFLTPVIAVCFGWIVFDDQITATFLLALFLVGAGIVLVTRKPRAAQ